jgi:hypothetical protein
MTDLNQWWNDLFNSTNPVLETLTTQEDDEQ